MQNEFSFTDAHHEDSPIIDVTIDGDHYTKHMPSHFSTGIINASDVGYIFGNYTPPMLGKMSVFRIVTKDIKGANYLRAIAWRS